MNTTALDLRENRTPSQNLPDFKNKYLAEDPARIEASVTRRLGLEATNSEVRLARNESGEIARLLDGTVYQGTAKSGDAGVQFKVRRGENGELVDTSIGQVKLSPQAASNVFPKLMEALSAEAPGQNSYHYLSRGPDYSVLRQNVSSKGDGEIFRHSFTVLASSAPQAEGQTASLDVHKLETNKRVKVGDLDLWVHPTGARVKSFTPDGSKVARFDVTSET